MDLGIILSNESIPTQLMEKIKKIQTVNGKYNSEDGNDYINYIQIRYDGETLEINIRKNEAFHTVTFDNQKEIPVNQELFYFVHLEEGATMKARIDFIEDTSTTSLKLRAEDSQWKWNLKMEIR